MLSYLAASSIIHIMQWKTVTTGLGKTVFGLWNNENKMLTLNYKSQSDLVYLESENGEKRCFKYKQKGFLKNKIVLENEYGSDLGKIKKEGNSEYVLIDEKRYYIHYKNSSEIEILPEGSDKPLATCRMDVPGNNKKTSNSLLMVLCLYLFGNLQKREDTYLAYSNL